MVDVQFTEPKFAARPQQASPRMTALLVRYGIGKNEQQANTFLLGLAAALMLATALLVTTALPQPVAPLTPEENAAI